MSLTKISAINEVLLLNDWSLGDITKTRTHFI
jgi:hypothetical protein